MYESSNWLKEDNIRNDNAKDQKMNEINSKKVAQVLRKAQNWKTPGIDQVTNFWLSYLPCTHSYLAVAFNQR